MTRDRTVKRAPRSAVALFTVFAFAALSAGLYALAANTLPAPTISVAPANPTNQTTASLTYTDQKSISSFQCSLDGSAFATCGTARPSTKSYPGPLSTSSHTFQVRAVSGSEISPVTSYTWTIDLTAPQASAITRTGANPTSASSVSWAVSFGESVTGVGTDDFQLVAGGLGGSPAITSIAGSGSAYTVTASTGSGTGTLALNLVDNDSIRDLAGNRLGGTGEGNGNLSGQVYGIDHVAPPAPVITLKPSDPSPLAESTFAWTDSESGLTFRCSFDGGAWQTCTSPYTFTVATNSNQLHQFTVRAYDAAGNIASAGYSWKVDPDVDFTISGNLVGNLYPAAWRPLGITITNPNHYTIYVTSLTVAVSSSPAGCPAADIEFIQSPLSSSHTFAVPAQMTLPVPAADRPQMSLKNRPYNQDACQNTTFQLAYAGTGTK